TPPTADHGLVRQSIDEIGEFQGFGGTAIGDALDAAVNLAQQSLAEGQQTIALRAAHEQDTKGLASILFLSDGAQTRGTLLPEEGAAKAKEANIPVYTVALGTPEGVIRGGFGFGGPGNQAPSPGYGSEDIPPPPAPETPRGGAEGRGGGASGGPPAPRHSSGPKRSLAGASGGSRERARSHSSSSRRPAASYYLP